MNLYRVFPPLMPYRIALGEAGEEVLEDNALRV